MRNRQIRVDELFEPYPDRPEALPVLTACSLCSSLPLTIRIRLAEVSHLAYADRGECLWTAGSEAKFFAVIGDGLVRMTRKSLHGREIVVEILGPGDAAGILATFSGTEFALTAMAVTSSWYLKVPNDAWNQAVGQEPAFCKLVVAELTPRLLRGYDFLASMMSGDVEQRLAMALIRVTELLSKSDGGDCFTIPITRLSLAKMACTTAESAIRTTTKWQRRGWIVAGHRSIQIVNLPAIRAILDQAPEERRS